MTGHAKARPWRVVRQANPDPDREMCTHRWEWTAELCSHRRARRELGTGVFFTARPGVTTSA